MPSLTKGWINKKFIRHRRRVWGTMRRAKKAQNVKRQKIEKQQPTIISNQWHFNTIFIVNNHLSSNRLTLSRKHHRVRTMKELIMVVLSYGLSQHKSVCCLCRICVHFISAQRMMENLELTFWDYEINYECLECDLNFQ